MVRNKNRAKGLTIVLNPHPAQRRVLESEARFVFMLAGTQGGKTSLGPWWLRNEVRRAGPGDYLAVTPTFPLLQLKMLPEFRRVWEDLLGLGYWKASERVFHVSRYGERILFQAEQSTATRIIFGSARNPESLESATAKAAWLDEVGQNDFRLESWLAIRRRLSLARGRVLGTTTIYNQGWMKSQIFDRRGDDDIEVIQFASIENPQFPHDEFAEMEASMQPHLFRMFYQGLYAIPPGMIYSSFVDEPRERGGHLVTPFEVPAEWPLIGGIDFGGANNARVLIARDPGSREYYAFSEELSGDKTTKQHAAALNTEIERFGSRQLWGGSRSESQQRRDWRAEGIAIREPVIHDVESGISRVYSLFANRQLFVFDSLVGLRDELGTYSRKLDRDTSEPTDVIENKAMFHRLDALRYAAQGMDVAAGASAVTDQPETNVRDFVSAGRERLARREGIVR